MIRQEAIPNGTRNNQRYFGTFVAWDAAIDMPDQILLHDAQPSGGLLIAVPPDRSEEMLAALHAAGVDAAAIIGEITAGLAGHITVTKNQS